MKPITIETIRKALEDSAIAWNICTCSEVIFNKDLHNGHPMKLRNVITKATWSDSFCPLEHCYIEADENNVILWKQSDDGIVNIERIWGFKDYRNKESLLMHIGYYIGKFCDN